MAEKPSSSETASKELWVPDSSLRCILFKERGKKKQRPTMCSFKHDYLRTMDKIFSLLPNRWNLNKKHACILGKIRVVENLEGLESWPLKRKPPGNWLGWYSVVAFVSPVENNAA